MSYDMRTDPVVIAKDKELAGEFPSIENNRPDVYMKWSDICIRYPHCWVFMDHVDFTEDMGIIGGILKYISYYKEDNYAEYAITKPNCLYMYTSRDDGRNLSLFYGYE